MQSFFSLDSKPMKMLGYLADCIALNLLFLLCCLPVFTVGAAQAGLYRGLLSLADPNDGAYVRAFFRGFRDGFGKITLVWCAFALVMGAFVWMLMVILSLGQQPAAAWMAIAAICLCALFQAAITPFHAKFGCTAFQLVRNAFLLILAHPLRFLAVGVLTWGPVILALSNLRTFLQGTFILFSFYYSVAFQFNIRLLRKPFRRLEEHARTADAAQAAMQTSEAPET